jgi:hypothetical protein
MKTSPILNSETMTSLVDMVNREVRSKLFLPVCSSWGGGVLHTKWEMLSISGFWGPDLGKFKKNKQKGETLEFDSQH